MDLNAVKSRPRNIYTVYGTKRVSPRCMDVKINEF